MSVSLGFELIRAVGAMPLAINPNMCCFTQREISPYTELTTNTRTKHTNHNNLYRVCHEPTVQSNWSVAQVYRGYIYQEVQASGHSNLVSFEKKEMQSFFRTSK